MTRSLLRDIHAKLARKEFSARELLESSLSAIENKDAEIHAFLDVWKEEARNEADAVDRRIHSNETISLIEGVPLAVKDNILIEGKPVQAASKILGTYTASYDATVIKKLKAARAVFVGRTNFDEFAMGGSTENSAFGPTRNPHDTSRVPGGTSGGSAAAVAGGMVPAAIGSDTGGSIRQPAAFCGVVGFKPSYGRVSRSGLIAMTSSFDQIGPLAESVEDAEILFRAIEGEDPLDATSISIKEEVQEKKEYVVGVPKEYFQEGLDKKIEETLRASFKKAEGAQFRFKEISLPSLSYALACYYMIMFAESSSNLSRFDGMRYGFRGKGQTLSEVYKNTRGEGFGTEVKRRIAIGTFVLSHGYYDAYYVQAQRVRTLISRDFQNAFETVDIIATPTTPTLPFKIGEKISDPLTLYLEDIYTVSVNLAGLPALSVPVGKIGNLPVGLQLIGKRFGDYQLLDIAKKYEAAIA